MRVVAYIVTCSMILLVAPPVFSEEEAVRAAEQPAAEKNEAVAADAAKKTAPKPDAPAIGSLSRHFRERRGLRQQCRPRQACRVSPYSGHQMLDRGAAAHEGGRQGEARVSAQDRLREARFSARHPAQCDAHVRGGASGDPIVHACLLQPRLAGRARKSVRFVCDLPRPSPRPLSRRWLRNPSGRADRFRGRGAARGAAAVPRSRIRGAQ